jgi:hypothetical protein
VESAGTGRAVAGVAIGVFVLMGILSHNAINKSRVLCQRCDNFWTFFSAPRSDLATPATGKSYNRCSVGKVLLVLPSLRRNAFSQDEAT